MLLSPQGHIPRLPHGLLAFLADEPVDEGFGIFIALAVHGVVIHGEGICPGLGAPEITVDPCPE